VNPENPSARGWPDEDELAPIVEAALAEDVGKGDATTRACVPSGAVGGGRIIAKAPGRLAGLAILSSVYHRLDPGIVIDYARADGDPVQPGDEIAALEGAFEALLTGERSALNFLTLLSGVATLTARYVEAIDGTGAKILDTRKTIPGFRVLQKYAVRCGGGTNHRMRLDDELLLKENHIAAAGGVAPAVRSAIARAPDLTLRLEVRTLEEVREGVDAGARALLLDNFQPDDVRAARKMLDAMGRRVEIEVSGGLRLDTVRSFAEAGADRLSVGALTHSAPALDLSMLLDLR